MHLKEFYEKQRKLDEIIVENTTTLMGRDCYDKRFLSDRITALSVEVSEFANEVAAFKYWKTSKVNNKEKQLEEYVDIYFFWLCIGNTMEFTPKEVEAAYHKKYEENIKRQQEGY